MGFEPVTSANTSAMLHQMSYEATHWEPGQSFMGKIEPTKMTWLPMCGVIAQLVEHRTRGEVTGLNPVEALNFFRLLFPNCINWWAHSEDLAIA